MRYQDPDDWDSSTEIECAYCGEHFYYELTRCPNCGRDVYEPEYDEEDETWEADPDRDVLEDWFAALAPAAAVFLGMVVSFAVGSILFILLRYFLGEYGLEWPGRGVLLASVPVGAAVGAFVAGLIESDHPRRMGWWVGGLSIIAALVLAGVDRDLTVSPWTGLDTLPLWAITVLSGAAAGEYLRRRRGIELAGALFRNVSNTEYYEDPAEEEELYEALFVICGQDPERVERLIDFERRYMPNANRRTLIESAIDRWERDNR